MRLLTSQQIVGHIPPGQLVHTDSTHQQYLHGQTESRGVTPSTRRSRALCNVGRHMIRLQTPPGRPMVNMSARADTCSRPASCISHSTSRRVLRVTGGSATTSPATHVGRKGGLLRCNRAHVGPSRPPAFAFPPARSQCAVPVPPRTPRGSRSTNIRHRPTHRPLLNTE